MIWSLGSKVMMKFILLMDYGQEGSAVRGNGQKEYGLQNMNWCVQSRKILKLKSKRE